MTDAASKMLQARQLIEAWGSKRDAEILLLDQALAALIEAAVAEERERAGKLVEAADAVRAQLFNCPDDAHLDGKATDREKLPIATAYDELRAAYEVQP